MKSHLRTAVGVDRWHVDRPDVDRLKRCSHLVQPRKDRSVQATGLGTLKDLTKMHCAQSLD